MSIRRELKHKSSRSQLRVRSDLLEAVKKGELIKIEKMLRKGEINQADLSIKDDSGNTCMLLALRNDHREVFVRILQEDVGVNTADNNNITPLHLICSKGWIECVNLLVKKGANVNAQDSKGNTPLHYAAEAGHTNIVQFLLNNGASIDVKGDQGKTPLHVAAHNNHFDVCSLLLERGASVHAQTDQGHTPLHMALMGSGNQRLVAKLIEKGASVMVKDSMNKTFLHYAATYDKHECMQVLAEAGVPVQEKGTDGRTALHDAALRSCKQCLNNLILLGCEVNEKDNNGSTPLHLIVVTGDPSSVNLLLNSGADINSRDNEGQQPLAIAIKSRRKTIVKLLIDRGADTSFLSDEANQNMISQSIVYMISCKDTPYLKFSKDKNGTPQIRAGTIEQLVTRLTYELYPDVRYQQTMLLTYRAFMTPHNLLDMIIARFKVEPPVEKQNDQEFLKTWTRSVKTPIQLRVLNVLRSWVEKHFRDFYQDPELLTKLRNFLKNEVTSETMQRIASQILRQTEANEKLEKEKQERIQENTQGNLRFSKSLTKLGIGTDESSLLLKWDHEIIAQQICLIEFDLFSALEPKEFLNQAWNKGTPEERQAKAPNIRAMITNSNKIMMWVATEIVSCKDISQRAEVITRFIRIAKSLLDYNNFNGLVEIVNGLDIAAVARLQRTWARVNIKQLLESLREITNSDKNFQKLRECIHSANPPVIPYLGRYLSDLTFVDDGNPNIIVEDNVELINFFKQKLIGDIILELQTYQQVGYKFQREPTIYSYITMFQTKSDKELFDMSLALEPREGSSGTSK